MLRNNRLLATSFVISLAINLTFLHLVGNSDLFEHADVIQDLRSQEIEVYKPPTPEKPQPKPKIAPPKPKPAAIIQPPKPTIKRTLPPPPVPQPHLTPPPAAAPRPTHPAPQPAIFVRTRPPLPRPNARPDPFVPLGPRRAVTQPVPRPAVNLGSHSAQGTISEPPTPPVTQPVVTPKPLLPDRAEPVPDTDNGNWPDVTLPDDVDVSSLTSSTIVISFEVDKRGRPRGARVKRSSGNSEVDNEMIEAVMKMRFKPAVQNGEAQEMEDEHAFSVGN